MGFSMKKPKAISQNARSHYFIFSPISYPVFLAGALVAILVGCKDDKKAPFSYGPEVPTDEIQAALLNPIKEANPQIKLGEFVHFAEIQSIANNGQNILSDTGQTVVERNEHSDRIVFTIIEHQITYGQSQNKKVSRELELTMAKPGDDSSGDNDDVGSVSVGGAGSETQGASSDKPVISENVIDRTNDHTNDAIRNHPTRRFVPDIPAYSITTGPRTDLGSYLAQLIPVGFMEQMGGSIFSSAHSSAHSSAKNSANNSINTAAGRVLENQKSWVTYHNLRIGYETAAPPEAVANEANCLGIPSCKIRLHHIAFDQVYWVSPTQSEKLAFEFTLSTDVPYLARLLEKCVTFLASLGEKRPSSVVVRQCSPVVNFRFEGNVAETNPDTTPQ